MERIRIQEENFDPYAELAQFCATLESNRAAYGAEAHFIGTMRDQNEGDAVKKLWLEHYPGMTEKVLQQIVAEERSRLKFGPALIIHRVGEILPGDPIVLVATCSPHRRAALDGVAHIIERLKHEAPFWKKEQLTHGMRWVESNTQG